MGRQNCLSAWSVSEELAALRNRYEPQSDTHVTRAINPVDTPSYGVPAMSNQI